MQVEKNPNMALRKSSSIPLRGTGKMRFVSMAISMTDNGRREFRSWPLMAAHDAARRCTIVTRQRATRVCQCDVATGSIMKTPDARKPAAIHARLAFNV